MERCAEFISSLAIVFFFSCVAVAQESVSIVQSQITIPTYELAEREVSPPFFSRGLYPYTSYKLSSRSSTPRPVTYRAIILENQYLKLTFVPELGGRIWAAYDKIRGREFFYRTAAVKPTPYNLRSTWPAGNLELYGPYDTHMITWPGEPWVPATRRNPDGSATVILSHVDHIFRDKIWLSVTLEPGQARLRVDARLYNPNPLEHRYLLWTNTGAPVNQSTRFFYPMTRTIGHVVASLGTWPEMNGVDYSWFKNHPGMLGLFGLDLYDNYIANYDTAARYGVLRWADRFEARGAKMWTWGTGSNAAREARTYADPGDGEYMELQSGRFLGDSEYHFLDPHTEDGWTEYWYPIADLDGVSTATPTLVAYLTRKPDSVECQVMATESFPALTISLHEGTREVFTRTASLRAGTVFKANVQSKGDEGDLVLQAVDDRARVLLNFKDFADGSHPGALVATENLPKEWPADPTAEQAGLQGEYEELAGHDAEARRLYLAALKKDSGSLRAHLALGRMAMRAGNISEALEHFQAAVERDPWSGEARYGLGVALTAEGQHRLARAEFAHISPNSSRFALRDAALGAADFALGDFVQAEVELRKASEANPRDLSALGLLAAVLRRQLRLDAAGDVLTKLEAADPTSATAAAERFLLARSRQAPADQEGARLDAVCASHPQQYIELAAQYARVNAWADVAEILQLHVGAQEKRLKPVDPMVLYWLAAAESHGADPARARQTLAKISTADRTPEIFPFRVEGLRVLEEITRLTPQDDLAWQLLGTLQGSLGRRQEAVAAWKKAVELKPSDRIAQRLLGFGYYEWLAQAADARSHLSRAVELDPKDSEAVVALAESQAAAGAVSEGIGTAKSALGRLPANDALRATLARLLILHEEPEAALAILQSKEFFVAESNPQLIDLYRETKLSQGLLLLRKGQTTSATSVLLEAGRLPGTIAASDFERAVVPKLAYYQGYAHWLRGDGETARKLWRSIAEMKGLEDEDAYFGARAFERLGERARARAIFESLAARSPSEGDTRRAQARAHYLRGLGMVGRGQTEAARSAFQQALRFDAALVAAKRMLIELELPRERPGPR
ncbi:MAG: DUF5107 domain-containing protein [Terriglobia bacterium]